MQKRLLAGLGLVLGMVACGPSALSPLEGEVGKAHVASDAGANEAPEEDSSGVRLLSELPVHMADATGGRATAPPPDEPERRAADARRDGEPRDAARDRDRDGEPRDAAMDRDRDGEPRDAAMDRDVNARDRTEPHDAGIMADARGVMDGVARPSEAGVAHSDDVRSVDASGDAHLVDASNDAHSMPADADEDAETCTTDCRDSADHLLISEIVVRPSGAEMIEIVNPTPVSIDLADYLLSDSHAYYKVATGTFTTASGSDFVARFPSGAIIGPGEFRTVALGNASGGAQSFATVYGKKPDFELRPTANGASDDSEVPNLESIGPGATIGANSSLTDSGEPVVLFRYHEGGAMADVDYVFYGTPTEANPAVDKTSGTMGLDGLFFPDTPVNAQHPASVHVEGGSLQRCAFSEGSETRGGGNGITGHDETSEDGRVAFVAALPGERTPGGPPSQALCTR